MGARLPTMQASRDYVAAGGLMSYGPNRPDLFRRAADHVDKILRGTKPGDIPVEQPTKFDLVINEKKMGRSPSVVTFKIASDIIYVKQNGRRRFLEKYFGAHASLGRLAEHDAQGASAPSADYA
jgi:ABC transporter substrate binding protein